MSKMVILFLFSTLSFALDADNIKTCLALSYNFQKNYHVKNNNYANNIEELATVKSAPTCQGLELEMTSTSKHKFLIKALYKNETWTVDQTKTIKKL